MFPPTVALVPIATVPAVIVVVPVPLLIVTVLFPVEAMLTPDAPVSVKAPALVVIFEAAPESIVNAPVVSKSKIPASISRTEFAWALASICTAVPFS